MSGRGRGSFGRGGFGGGFGRGAQLPSEKFPEIEDLGKAQYSVSNKQLINWSRELQNFWKESSYYYMPAKKVGKTDIERYSDRQQRATKKKARLEDYIFMDADHLPGELTKSGGARFAKNVQWEIGFEDEFKKVEEKIKGQENEAKIMRKAEAEDKDDSSDDEVKNDTDEESDDSGDDGYAIGEYIDDDEDDLNDNQDEGNPEDDAIY